MSEWIDANKTNPNEQAWFLVVDFGKVCMAFYYPTREQWETSDDNVIYPTYWMPLPEPPK